MKSCHVIKDEVVKDLACKECFVKLVPLKNEVISTCSTISPLSKEMVEEDEESFGAVTEAVADSLEDEDSIGAVTESIGAVTESIGTVTQSIGAVSESIGAVTESIGAVTEAVAESLKEAVSKEVKRKIGETVALYLFDQWWAQAEEKYKAVQEQKLSSRGIGEQESNRKCHLCKFTALSENDLTEHLMINHVFDFTWIHKVGHAEFLSQFDL